MSEAIIVALISGGLTMLGDIISNSNSNTKRDAIVEKKIEELTREVREHNNFARRMPVVEEQIRVLNADIKELKSYHQLK